MCPNEVPQLPDGGYCMGNTCSAPLCLSIAPGKSPMHVSGWECAIQYGLDFLERLSCHPGTLLHISPCYMGWDF